MFCVGQKVLYGANGVCTIDEITVKHVGKVSMEYYVLKPVGSSTSTLFVPTANAALVGKIREVLTVEQINAVLNDLPANETWIDNKLERTEHFKEIIARADSRELVQLIRTIRAHEKEQTDRGKRLHLSDERLLKEAEKMIGGEFSLVLQISPEEVMNRILS